MTADPVAIAPAGGGVTPGSLAEPQVLYATTAQAVTVPVVNQRLNERLLDELLHLIGTPSNALQLAVVAAVRGVQWQDTRQRTVGDLAAAILAQVAADPHLASEASAIRAHIAASPSRTVADVLGLDVPLIDNPVMHTDVTRALVIELAHLAGLGDAATQAVTQHSEALVNSSAATLDALVGQGRLSKHEQASLTTNLELAKLSHDNLVLIRALLAAGVTSPVALVA
ncbi:MAG: hypothetical protein ABSA02_43640, partial [Trebonia sp.]